MEGRGLKGGALTVSLSLQKETQMRIEEARNNALQSARNEDSERLLRLNAIDVRHC